MPRPTDSKQVSSSLLIPSASLPPVKALVQVSFQDTHQGAEPKAVYSSRIVLRKHGVDYLDALRDRHGEPTNAWGDTGLTVRLWWGYQQHLLEYPIEICEVLDPIPSLEVAYLGPPRQHNRRHQARADTKAPVRFRVVLEHQDSGVTTPQLSVTRNISYAGVRFFSLQKHAPDTILWLEVTLDTTATRLSHHVSVLRSSLSALPFQGSNGYDIMAQWNPPLEGDELGQWKDFFDRHRYD